MVGDMPTTPPELVEGEIKKYYLNIEKTQR